MPVALRLNGFSMNISPRHATCDENNLWVELNDGRTLGVPLAWFPHLLAATPEEREACELSPRGIHWDTLDEDISMEFKGIRIILCSMECYHEKPDTMTTP